MSRSLIKYSGVNQVFVLIFQSGHLRKQSFSIAKRERHYTLIQLQNSGKGITMIPIFPYLRGVIMGYVTNLDNIFIKVRTKRRQFLVVEQIQGWLVGL